jgi:hypothetical protein
MAAENIFSQYLHPVRSVQDYTNDMDRNEQNALTLAASRLTNQTGQQTFADTQKARQLAQENAARGGDMNALAKAYLSSGLTSQAQALQKQELEFDEKRSTISKNQFDLEQKKRVTAATHMASFQTPQDAIADIQARVQSGEMSHEQAAVLSQRIPQDPAAFSQWQVSHMREFLTPKERIDMVTAKPIEVTTGQQKYSVDQNPNSPTFGKQIGAAPVQMVATPGEVLTDLRTRSEGAANRGVQIRGQNMTDIRSRESTAATFSKPFEATGPDGTPILVQQDKQGNIIPVKGYSPKVGAGGALTESQGNATNFAARMKSASEILIPLEDEGVTAGNIGTMAAGSAWTNFMATPEGRRYNQAAKNWVSANLRKESGAAIPESEMVQEIKKYFGVPGDDKTTLDQKRQARSVAEEGMMVQAGPGAKTVPTTLNKTRTGAAPNSVQTPDGKTHTFPTAAAAAAFRKAAGL